MLGNLDVTEICAQIQTQPSPTLVGLSLQMCLRTAEGLWVSRPLLQPQAQALEEGECWGLPSPLPKKREPGPPVLRTRPPPAGCGRGDSCSAQEWGQATLVGGTGRASRRASLTKDGFLGLPGLGQASSAPEAFVPFLGRVHTWRGARSPGGRGHNPARLGVRW